MFVNGVTTVNMEKQTPFILPRGGRVQGVCAAGYLCVSGSADFTPLSGLTQCRWGMQCAGPCPAGTVHQFKPNNPEVSLRDAWDRYPCVIVAGFFCPAGAGAAELCPANTFRSSPGGASLRDCLHCPPQHWCKPGLSVHYSTSCGLIRV